MFLSGGALNSLKWGQNEDVKGEAEDLKSATIEFYRSNIVYYDSFDVFKAIWAKSLHRNALWANAFFRIRSFKIYFMNMILLFQELRMHVA